MIRALLTAGMVGTSLLAFGQDARPLVGKDIAVPSARFPAVWYPNLTGGTVDAPIAGAPFSATITMTTETLDVNGAATEVSRSKTLKWRDTAGRSRDEELPPEIEGQPDAFEHFPHQVTVVDTLHHCQFTWVEPLPQDQQREAVVSCNSLELSRAEESLAKRMSDPKAEVIHQRFGTLTSTTTSTLLGERTLQNLVAVGVRSVTTDVDAAGKLQGTKEVEIWWSPALYVSLVTRVKTRGSIVTWEMTGIERVEPDEKLFYPPEGYSIRKEAEVPALAIPARP